MKTALVAVAILANAPEIARRLTALSDPAFQPIATTAFAVLLLLTVAGLFGAAFTRTYWLRWIFATLLASAGLLVNTYQWAVGDFMSYDAFVTMIASSGDIGSAIDQHGPKMALAGLVSLALLLGIGLAPRETRSRLALLRFAFAPIMLGLTGLLFLRGGDGANGLPPAMSGTAYALLYGYEAVTSATTVREDVSFASVDDAPTSDIVLIIDESIAGAYLDINDRNGVRSGLADAEINASIFNFGLAAAVTNCSAGANAVLRFGGTRDNYMDRLRRGPSIWAFAANAGYETVYIDAQRTGRAFQNLMDADEAAEIGSWVQFDGISPRQRDHRAADKLAELLGDDRAQFILVNKIGGHFPVSDKFPDSHAQYRPMLPRKSLDVSEAEADDMDGSQASWRLYRNSYRNTLLWNVGGFFDLLIEAATIGNATIIYTSDHGQSFHERGEYSEATHCTPNPQIEEGVVPLVVIGGANGDTARWEGAASANHDATSNYRIFPTLLALMRYRESEYSSAYGKPLWATDPEPMTFNTNFNARLGSSPRWKAIDIADVQAPPETDHEQPVVSIQ